MVMQLMPLENTPGNAVDCGFWLPAGSVAVTTASTGPEVAEPGGPTRTIVTRALLGSDAGLFGAARLPMVAAEMDTNVHPARATMRKII